MSLQKKPIFKPGNILTHEMLEILKEAAIDAEELKYIGFSDGVLKGCHITTAQGMINVGRGIIMIKSKAYYLQSEVIVPVHPTNSTQILVVRATEEEESYDFVVREVKVQLVEENDMLPTDVELCRFRLQQGAVLRSTYRDFKDMDTEYDTVCLKYAKWSSYEKSSLSIEVLKKFMEEAVKCAITDVEDKNFLSRIAATDGTTLNAAEINWYLSWRLNKPYSERGNAEMYQGLLDVLRMIKNGRVGMSDRRPERRKMIVD